MHSAGKVNLGGLGGKSSPKRLREGSLLRRHCKDLKNWNQTSIKRRKNLVDFYMHSAGKVNLGGLDGKGEPRRLREGSLPTQASHTG